MMKMTIKHMKIVLIPEKIIENLYTEEQLSDLSVLESIYEIRKLKAAILSNGKPIEVTTNKMRYPQVYSNEYNIWFQSNEYRELKDIILLEHGQSVFYGNTIFRVHSQSETCEFTLIENDDLLFQVETKLLQIIKTDKNE